MTSCTQYFKKIMLPAYLGCLLLLLSCDYYQEVLDLAVKIAHDSPLQGKEPFQLRLNSRPLLRQQPELQRLEVRNLFQSGEEIPSPQQFSWRQDEKGFLLTIARLPAKYQLTVHARQNNHETIKRTLQLHIDEVGQLSARLLQGSKVKEVLEGKWLAQESGHQLSWLEQHPAPEAHLIHSYGERAVLRIWQQQVLWSHSDGSLSYGRFEQGRIVWQQRYHRGNNFANDKQISDVVFQDKIFYLATYGNGLFVGRMHPDRIEWLKHYPRIYANNTSHLNRLSLQGNILAVGTANIGLVLLTMEEENIRAEENFRAPLIGSNNCIQYLKWNGEQLLWYIEAHPSRPETRGIRLAPMEQGNLLLDKIVFNELPKQVNSILALELHANHLLLSSPQIGLLSATLNQGKATWQNEASLATDNRPYVLLQEGSLLLAGGSTGLHIGLHHESKIKWQQHFQQEKRGKMLDDEVWSLSYQNQVLLVGSKRGLAVARIRPYQDWKLIDH